jgi:hypothetical protein
MIEGIRQPQVVRIGKVPYVVHAAIIAPRSDSRYYYNTCIPDRRNSYLHQVVLNREVNVTRS